MYDKSERYSFDRCHISSTTIITLRKKQRGEWTSPAQLQEPALIEAPQPHASQEAYLEWHVFRRAGGFGLIAPLDNLMWDLNLVEMLFGFQYAWEVYKPADKRDYGYNLLPVLYGDRLAARLDPEFDRAGKVLPLRTGGGKKKWTRKTRPCWRP